MSPSRSQFLGLTVPLLTFVFSSCWGDVADEDWRPPARPEALRQTRPVRVVAVGDILLGAESQRRLDKNGYNWPLSRLGKTVAGHDLLVGNLEGPITTRGEPVSESKGYIYRTKPAAAVALGSFGFDLVSLANNHSLDYGTVGLFDTMSYLEGAGIEHFGAGRNRAEAAQGIVIKRAGVRIGFVGFMKNYGAYDKEFAFFAKSKRPGIAKLSEKTVKKAFARLRPQVDVLIASVHWGSNYKDVTRFQKRWGPRLARWGADVVIGHHPHVVQGFEIVDGVPILYSLGNFVFGTRGRFRKIEKPFHHGWVAHIEITDARVSSVRLQAIKTDNTKVKYQPRPARKRNLESIVKAVNLFDVPVEIVGRQVILPLR